jgi:hypothetical protein
MQTECFIPGKDALLESTLRTGLGADMHQGCAMHQTLLKAYDKPFAP